MDHLGPPFALCLCLACGLGAHRRCLIHDDAHFLIAPLRHHRFQGLLAFAGAHREAGAESDAVDAELALRVCGHHRRDGFPSGAVDEADAGIRQGHSGKARLGVGRGADA